MAVFIIMQVYNLLSTVTPLGRYNSDVSLLNIQVYTPP